MNEQLHCDHCGADRTPLVQCMFTGLWFCDNIAECDQRYMEDMTPEALAYYETYKVLQVPEFVARETKHHDIIS